MIEQYTHKRNIQNKSTANKDTTATKTSTYLERKREKEPLTSIKYFTIKFVTQMTYIFMYYVSLALLYYCMLRILCIGVIVYHNKAEDTEKRILLYECMLSLCYIFPFLYVFFLCFVLFYRVHNKLERHICLAYILYVLMLWSKSS